MNRENKDFLSEIYNAITFFKVIIVIVCSFVYFPIIFFSSIDTRDRLVYIIFFGMLIGYAITCPWFFQGIEKFKYITYNFLLSYVLYTILLFLFVHSPSDVVLAAFFETFYIIFIGILNIILVTKKFGVKLGIPKLTAIRKQLKESWDIFFQGLSYWLYTYSITFILGLLTNNTIYAYYTGASQIISAATGFIGAITVAVFPRMSKLVKESKERALHFVRRYFIFISGLGFVIFLGIYFLSDIFAFFFKGLIDFTHIVPVLKIEAILPLIVIINNTLGYQIMLALDYKKPFVLIYIGALALCLILEFIFVPLYSYIGTAWIAVGIESYIAIVEFIYLYKRGINIFTGLRNNLSEIFSNRKKEEE